MNLSLDHIERIRELGYSESEARFLYIVAVHSGYFTLRQFLNFTGAHPGKRSARFSQKLLKKGHARVRDYMGAGSIYHLFSRTVYGQIDKDNLGNRRLHSFDLIRNRLLLLDFILSNQELDYFETEGEKVLFFCEKLGVAKDFLPAKIYEGGSGSLPTVRYFVDKFPLFMAPPVPGAPSVVTLSFVDAGVGTVSNFVTHLHAYQSLFSHLERFRFLYIASKEVHFKRAGERFRDLVKRPLETDVSGEVLRYFQIRKKWDNREYVVPNTADFEFLNEARRRFQGERFDSLYRQWLEQSIDEGDLRTRVSALLPPRTVFFDTYLVIHHRSPIAEREQSGVNVA
jgi:hypothetical protein